MFDPGSKIVVLASTQKSGAGPRKGSIGHIIASGTGSIVDNNLLATSNVVGFHRFGFEQRSRFEVRTVINLLQLINNLQEDSVEKQINSFHNIFNSSKIDDILPRVIDCIQLSVGTPVVIMVPYGEIDDDLLTCGNSEFDIWVRVVSLVMTSVIQHLTAAGGYRTDNTYITMNKLRSLLTRMSDKTKRDNYITLMLSDPSERQGFVCAVRHLFSIQNCNSNAFRYNHAYDTISQLHHTYSNGRFTQETIKTIYKLLYDNLYNISFNKITGLLSSDKPGKECVRNVIFMKEELRRMYEKLFIENTSN